MRGPVLLVATVLLAGCLSDGDEARLPSVDEPSRTELLLGPTTQSVTVVAHVTNGREPSEPTVRAVQEEFSRLFGKSTRLEVRMLDLQVTPGKHWTHDELIAVAGTLTSEPWPAGVGVMHAVSMPGCFDYTAYDPARGCIEGGTVGDVAFILADQVHDESTEVPMRDLPAVGWYAYERYLFVHELGHVAGLIDLEVPDSTGRPSTEGCTCHTSDPASVMYQWHRTQVVTPYESIVERVQDDNVHHYTFSDLDLADVRAYQAGLQP